MAGRHPTLAPLREHEELSAEEGRAPEWKAPAASLDLAELTLGEEIGRGGFSKVYRGTYRGETVAVKKMPVENDSARFLDRELSMLQHFQTAHPSLIKYLGAAIKNKEVFIVTEFMEGGDLSSILSKHVDVPLPWRLRCRIARDALQGIVALHSNDMIHRDVKSENFLLDDKWRCVVADFGFARKTQRGTETMMTICGTDEFLAPELLFGEIYDCRADVFSFGIFLCELLARKIPGKDGFLQREPRSKFQLDFDALRAMVPLDAPPSLVELAVQCCAYEAEYRMTSEEALEWLTALTEELEAQAESDPTPMPPALTEIRKRPQVLNTMTVAQALEKRKKEEEEAAAAGSGAAGAAE
jgi:serine/threonine protein kinase